MQTDPTVSDTGVFGHFVTTFSRKGPTYKHSGDLQFFFKAVVRIPLTILAP